MLPSYILSLREGLEAALIIGIVLGALRPEAFALNYPSLWNKILDAAKSQIHVIDMPPCRRMTKGGKSAAGHKKNK